MGNKTIISSGKMTGRLILYWILWGILVGALQSALVSTIANPIESFVAKAVVVVLIQGLCIIVLWKLSTLSSFKDKTISEEDIPKVMKNLLIYTIVIIIISCIINVYTVNNSIDQAVDSNYQLKFTEHSLSKVYNDEQMAKYNEMKENYISEVKKKVNEYIFIVDIAVSVVYLAVLKLEKKELIKYVKQNVQ